MAWWKTCFVTRADEIQKLEVVLLSDHKKEAVCTTCIAQEASGLIEYGIYTVVGAFDLSATWATKAIKVTD